MRSVFAYLKTASTTVTSATADSLLCRLSIAVTSPASINNVTAEVETLAVSAVTSSLQKVELTLPQAVTLASVLSTLSTAAQPEGSTGATTILRALSNLTSCVKSQVQDVSQTLGDKVLSALGGLVANRQVLGTAQGNGSVLTFSCQVGMQKALNAGRSSVQGRGSL